MASKEVTCASKSSCCSSGLFSLGIACMDLLPSNDFRGTICVGWKVCRLLNSGFCSGDVGGGAYSGILACTGTGGNALCKRAKLSSSRTSALPTEKIVPRVSLLPLFLSPDVPAIVLGKHITGNPSTRSSSFRDVSAGTGGMLSVSLGVRIAWTVKTGAGWYDCGRCFWTLFERHFDPLESLELEDFSLMTGGSRIAFGIVGKLC
jgi:hypothetical protein